MHTKQISTLILALPIIAGVLTVGAKNAEAVNPTYLNGDKLDSILTESSGYKGYEDLVKKIDKEGEDPNFGSYSDSYLKDHPRESSIMNKPFEDKMYCGDTTMYTISGESPAEYAGSLKRSSYNNFWSGSWFHSFVHNLTMPSDNSASSKMLFPSVPGWRLDGVWDYNNIRYQNNIQHVQNSFQITRVENGSVVATPYDTEDTPTGVADELIKRLTTDVTWFNKIKYFPLKRRALVIGNGLGADVAYQVSKKFGNKDVDYIYVDPYKISKSDNVPNVIRWNKPSLNFASFRLNNNLFGKISSSSNAREQALQLYQEIKKVVDKNMKDRDKRCDNYSRLAVCVVPYVFVEEALKRSEPHVTNPLLECGNEYYPVPNRFLRPFDPEIKADKTRFTANGAANPVTPETEYKDSTADVVSGYLKDLFRTSTKSGSRSGNGQLHFTSYGSTGDKTPDSNTKAKRGNNNNLLTLGSLALSPDLIRKYHPAHGAEILINGVHIGYYDDSSASSYKGVSILNTLDIYDPDNKYNDALFRVIPAGKWTLTTGPVRAQIRNVPSPKPTKTSSKK